MRAVDDDGPKHRLHHRPRPICDRISHDNAGCNGTLIDADVCDDALSLCGGRYAQSGHSGKGENGGFHSSLIAK
jgi:hypothetical protein